MGRTFRTVLAATQEGAELTARERLNDPSAWALVSVAPVSVAHR